MLYPRRLRLCVPLLLALMPQAHAYDLDDRFSISGVLAGAMQCQSPSEYADAINTCGGTLPFQPQIGIHASDRDEFLFKFGFAAGGGLTGPSPFKISSWAIDGVDDVRDINGSGRNYLLTAWYKHRFSFSADHTLNATIGLIDASEYLDENAYANDPYTQFMNAAFNNGPNIFVPSYDLGGALEWNIGQWSLHGVVMNVNRNDFDERYLFYGIEAAYTLESVWGSGHYRILLDGTSNDFLDPAGIRNVPHEFLVLSFDQEVGRSVGTFLRLGWQDDTATINYGAIYSGGIHFNGIAWGRVDDSIGLAYAHLDSGNTDINATDIAEGYYRLALAEGLSLTGDLQYMRDILKRGNGAGGFVFGARATVEF